MYGINAADIQRSGLKVLRKRQEKALGKIRATYGSKNAELAQHLGTLYSSLPELPLNSAQAVPLFERYTKRAARLLNFPINPRIVDIEGRLVWDF